MHQSNKYSGCIKVYKITDYFLFLCSVKNITLLSSNDLSMNETGDEVCSTDGCVSNDTGAEQTSILSESDNFHDQVSIY